MKCENCGNENKNGKFCSACGAKLPNIESSSIKEDFEMVDGVEKNDLYLKELEKKKEFAENVEGASGLLTLILCGLFIKNNWGYRDVSEIVITCLIIGVVIHVIYCVIAACIGIYKASERVEKYIKLKNEIGRVEAIKIMEQTTTQNGGFNLLNAGIKGGYELAKFGIGGIWGFVITILLLIIAISLC